MLIIRTFAKSKSSIQYSCCPGRRASCSAVRKQNGIQTISMVLHEPVPLSKEQQLNEKSF